MFLVILGILLLLIIGFFMESKREQRYFVVKRKVLGCSKLDNMSKDFNLVVLSDLHGKVYGVDNDILLKSIENENPDAILIAGDMLVGKVDEEHSEAVSFCTRLPEIAPVYYALGNHEQRMKEDIEVYGDSAFIDYKRKLVKAGVNFIENNHIDFEYNGSSVSIYGLELPMDTYKKFKKIIVNKEDVEQCIGKPDKTRFNILLAHNPAYVPAYKEWGADMIVSGHLHGGLIRLPFIGAVITPQMRLFPKYSGEITLEDGHIIVVSKGLGTHTFNIRFLNEAEVISLKFQNR